MSLALVKNTEYNILPTDLNELVKFAEVKEYPPLTRIFKEGDDADTIHCIVQGDLIATYMLTEKDK